jgi:4-amino-4-deoxy-L-arabinose transferase-like glycosyltransferase
MEDSGKAQQRGRPLAELGRRTHRHELTVLAAGFLIYFGCILSPPSLMDDVDAVQAQIARNMLDSGDWVTARLNGVKYLEKAPLIYWLIAASYAIFGVSDLAARLPLALAAVLLGWLVYRFGRWAFGQLHGFYAGLIMLCCAGLWLFTRIQIPDAMLTAAVTLSLWSFLRALDPQEHRPRFWAFLMAASIGLGLLLKGLIGAVIPAAAVFFYLLSTRQLLSPEVWRRLRPLSGAFLVVAIAAPWHILAILRNPPYFDFTWGSTPGQYRGFFWFYFLNEHVFRFLGMRHPRDYNTVPRLLFWALHLVWLFPWSAFAAGTVTQPRRLTERAGRAHRLLLCWIAFVLLFFTFSTTQEYYSMPCYPALALLLAGALVSGGPTVRLGAKLLGSVCLAAAALLLALYAYVWNIPAPGDISSALRQNPDLYTLSLGHMADLTLQSFAYLKTPLLLAALALLAAGWAAFRLEKSRMVLAVAAMMVVFLHAARLALVAFDPYLSSRPIAEALRRAPPGTLIVDNQYYTFSSVFFYANTRALLLNGRVNNLEYGSYAPDAPDVFIDDAAFQRLWRQPRRYYLAVEGPRVDRIAELVGRQRLHQVLESGGKFLFTNLPLQSSPPARAAPASVQAH